ncbi:MAG: PAS domain S-box protein [Betaproteobacteria bacterium]|nr:PAS domain S-box protein [Betaproteobacteria bacterium]
MTHAILQANPDARALLTNDSSANPKNWLDSFHPEDRERLLSHIEKISSGHSDHETLTCRQASAPGDLLTRLEMMPLNHRGTKPTSLLVCLQDAKPSGNQENPSPSEWALLSRFVSESPATLAMLDRDMNYLAVSERWLSDHQLEGKSLVGKSHYDTFPNLPEKWKEEHQRALQGESIHMEDEPLLRKSGKIKWLHRDIRPWRTAANEIGGILIFSEDVTAKKNAEDALQYSEFRYRGVIEAASDGFVMANMQGSVLASNHAYARLSGYSEDELMKMQVAELEAHEGRNEILRRMRQIMKQGHACFETVHRRKDGTTFPVEISASFVPSMGGVVFAFIRDITDRKFAEVQIASYVRKIEKFTEDTLKAVSTMVEHRDPYTAGHERRVGILSADIARELGFSEKRCNDLKLVSHVHDIGKIGIPSEILTKPGKLTPLEYQMVQTHVEKGYEILKDVQFTMPIAEIIYQHHERMNGSGYPRRLKGDEILQEARILAVSDVVESMMSHRPYRPAHGQEKALQEIEENAGLLYDPDVVAACLNLFRVKGYSASNLN